MSWFLTSYFSSSNFGSVWLHKKLLTVKTSSHLSVYLFESKYIFLWNKSLSPKKQHSSKVINIVVYIYFNQPAFQRPQAGHLEERSFDWSPVRTHLWLPPLGWQPILVEPLRFRHPKFSLHVGVLLQCKEYCHNALSWRSFSVI